MQFVFRSVRLGSKGKAIGYTDSGAEAVVLVPCQGKYTQSVNIDIGIEPEDGSWTNGIIEVKRATSPTSGWFSLNAQKTLSSATLIAAINGIEYPYIGLEITTANSTSAFATVVITTTDGGLANGY